MSSHVVTVGDGEAAAVGKASSAKQDAGRREKIAAQRAAEKRQQARNRLLLAGGSILAVIAIVVAFLVIKSNSSSTTHSTASSGASDGPTGAALADLIHTTTTVPHATLREIGSGMVVSKPSSISGSELRTSNGKPEMLYMGAEYCPYCAAERWAMVVALSRFGSFSGLATTHSAITSGAGQQEVYPNTRTWTFVHSKFKSDYVAFTSVEMNTNIPEASTGGYTTLQTPTAQQQALLTKYDAPPYVPASSQGAIPFVDFGNKYLIVGASYDPQVLSGLSWEAIASDLHNPSSPVARAIGGSANYMIAALCRITGDHPGSVCTEDIKKLQRQL
jgi:hypothetical protein